MKTGNAGRADFVGKAFARAQSDAREQLVAFGRSSFDHGFSCGPSANLSVRLDGGGIMAGRDHRVLDGAQTEELPRVFGA